MLMLPAVIRHNVGHIIPFFGELAVSISHLKVSD